MKTIKQTLKQLESQIKKVEKEMTRLIKQDGDMYHNFKMSKSVKGVGNVMAIQMLLHTHNYSRFGTWREFSSLLRTCTLPISIRNQYKSKTNHS